MTSVPLRLYLGTGVLVTSVMLAATAVLSTVGTLAPFLAADLGLSPSSLGLALTLYSIAAAVSAIPSGALADSFDTRVLSSAVFIVAAILLAMIAVAQTYWLLIAVMLLAGATEALGNPTTNRVIQSQIPAGHRGWIVGAKQSGAVLSLVVAGVVLAPLADRIGWRRALLFLGALALVGVVLSSRIAGASPAYSMDASNAASSSISDHNTPRPGLTLYALFMGVGDAIIIGHLPLYLYQDIGVTETVAGLTAGLMGTLAVVGRLVWSRIVELRKQGSGLEILAIIALVALGAILLIVTFAESAPHTIWLAAAALGFSALAWNAVAMLSVISTVQPGKVGRRTGEIMAGFLAGAAIGPLAFGTLVEQTGAYELGWIFVIVVYAIAAGIAISADFISSMRTRFEARRKL